ncbi:helix-turn-helix transcriptional regulator [Flindersiella endophytica]
MRASRLVSIVLLLQSRGRMRARDLADALEVTVRTIYRDVESLNAAGIPIVGEAGNHGGYSLLEGYRTRLTGLTTDEAQSLFLSGVPAAAAALGVTEHATAAQLKLLAAINPTLRDQAEHAQQRIHLDPTPWGSVSNPEPWLPQLYKAVWSDRLIRIRYGTSQRDLLVTPLGLVCKGANWYLIAIRDEEYRTYRVSRIQHVVPTEQTFTRRPDFDLVVHWQATVNSYTDTLPRTVVKLRLRGSALTRVRWVQAHARTISEPDPHGWANAELVLEDEDNALTVIRMLGSDVLVVEPRTLRRQAILAAQAFADANTDLSNPT